MPKHNLSDISDQHLAVKDGHDARCPACGSYEIGVEQSIKDGIVSTYYICNDCGTTFL